MDSSVSHQRRSDPSCHPACGPPAAYLRPSLAAFITTIGESSFRYTQGLFFVGHSRPGRPTCSRSCLASAPASTLLLDLRHGVERRDPGPRRAPPLLPLRRELIALA